MRVYAIMVKIKGEMIAPMRKSKRERLVQSFQELALQKPISKITIQIIVTDLAQQADGHAIQSRIFASEGFTKLADKYACKGIEPCDYNTVGQIFYSNGWQRPKGLCENSWKAMQEYVMTLAHGGKNFYDGWTKFEDVAIISCNDGFRPVIYKVEATDEEAEVFEEE